MIRTLKASKGKVFAYMTNKDTIIYLGKTLYLGVNDDGSRYFETEPPIEIEPEEENISEEINN